MMKTRAVAGMVVILVCVALTALVPPEVWGQAKAGKASSKAKSLLPEPVQRRIEQLFQEVAQELQAGRCPSQGKDNLAVKLHEIESLDPGNAEVEEAWREVVEGCLGVARQAIKEGRPDPAREAVQVVEMVKPGDQRLKALKNELAILAKKAPPKEDKESSTAKPETPASPTPTRAAQAEETLTDQPQPQDAKKEAAAAGPAPAGEAPGPEYERLLKGERALRQAYEALAESRLEDAIALYQEAVRLIPQESSLKVLGQRLAEARMNLKEDAEKKITQAEVAAQKGDLDQANLLLDQAAMVLGWTPRITELKSRLDRGRPQPEAGRPVEEKSGSLGLRFIRIPAGRFWMGSEMGPMAYPNEIPRHQVTITKPFWIGVYEVTQKEWIQIMGTNPSRFVDEAGQRPVDSVSFEEIQEFLRRLSQKEQRRYRLPTEAEWEYACRAGTDTDYSFGDDPKLLIRYGWYIGCSGFRSQPVGLKEPNAWGLYDMHGNVAEWVGDWYQENYYSLSPVQDPQGPSLGETRVIRGGSWLGGPDGARSGRRLVGKPGIDVGFRVVMEEGPGL